MRFLPSQPLPAWAEAARPVDTFRPLWPVGSPPPPPRHESPTTFTKRPT